MLENLNIKNLALVEQLEISPSSGFNAVTGETGAGKSLILGALKLLAGWRTSADIIRKGAKSCEVSGDFVFSDQALLKKINEKLDKEGAPPCEGGHLLLKRVVSESGSRAFANGSAVTIAWLKSLGDMLVDIHGPHDNQTILQPAVQLRLLDDYAGNSELLEECAKTWKELNGVREELKNIGQNQLNPEEIALLKHQLKEIDGAGLFPEEEPALVEEFRLASHSRHLVELANGLCEGLDQGPNSLTEQLSVFVRMALEIQEIDEPAGTKFYDSLQMIFENLQGAAGEAEEYAARINIDKERLVEMEERLDLLQKLKRKYGRTIEDVLATAERIRSRLASSGSAEETKTALEAQETELASKHGEICNSLRKSRISAAEKLASTIEDKLQHLGFAKAKFGIDVKPGIPGANGEDEVEFSFAPNLGEDAHPLRKIASSGEIARVMLAVRTALSAVDNVPILVFDEIDANIGGRVAGTVAEELKTVAAAHQVFSITHLPLIAAAGQCHFMVEKTVEGDRTFARIIQLEGKARVAEITRMLGADSSDTTAKKHAEELLKKPKSTGKGSIQPTLLLLLAALFCLLTSCSQSSSDDRLATAIAAMEQQNWDEAKENVTICLRHDHENVEALAIRAICFLRTGDEPSLKRAVRDLEKARGLVPKRTDINYLYGLALYQHKEFAAAIAALEGVLAQLPPDKKELRGHVLAMLGASYNACNQINKGLSRAQILQTSDIYRNRQEIYCLLAMMALKNRNYKQALSYLAKGQKIAPDSEAILQNIAVLYDLQMNEPAKARQFYIACHKLKSKRGDEAGCRRIERRLRMLPKGN